MRPNIRFISDIFLNISCILFPFSEYLCKIMVISMVVKAETVFNIDGVDMELFFICHQL